MNETAKVIAAVRVCPFCNNPTRISIVPETEAAYYRYSAYGHGYIQDVPVPQFENYHCKAIVREFLKTGFCLDCMKIVFGGDDKDYEEVKAYKG